MIAKSEAEAIILREKDLSEEEYFILAKSVQEICDKYGKNLIIHNFIDVAKKLGIRNIQLPFSKFISLNNLHNDFASIGTSVHSIEDAVLAEKSGADYIIAGHIFTTDCKKGLAPRGINFLKDVCNAVKIPVYAIGGIDNNSVS